MNSDFKWGPVLCMVAALLWGLPLLSLAATDTDLDGIDDALEQPGAAGISFNGQSYPACATTVTIVNRYTCVSPTSKDVFVYLVTSTAAGGYLAANGLITMSTPVDATQCAPPPQPPTPSSCTGVFGFITGPNTPTTTGKVDGLGVGVHVAVVTAAPANRSVGLLGQQAVVMTVNESPSAVVFGATDEGTPSNTGKSTIWPVYQRSYLTRYVTGGVDKPTVWKPYLQRTASHELSHASALTAAYNSKLGQYHYATGSGTVMDDQIQCNSKTQLCAVYNDYASGDRLCLLGLVSPTTNPLQCTGLQIFQ